MDSDAVCQAVRCYGWRSVTGCNKSSPERERLAETPVDYARLLQRRRLHWHLEWQLETGSVLFRAKRTDVRRRTQGGWTAVISIAGGRYDDDIHAYYDESGKWVPGLTSILSICGFNDYSMIQREVLENAA